MVKEQALGAVMTEFPIQGGDSYRDPEGKHRQTERTTVPIWLARVAWAEYCRRFGTGQSFERLAERGGFGRQELLMLLRGDKGCRASEEITP